MVCRQAQSMRHSTSTMVQTAACEHKCCTGQGSCHDTTIGTQYTLQSTTRGHKHSKKPQGRVPQSTKLHAHSNIHNASHLACMQHLCTATAECNTWHTPCMRSSGMFKQRPSSAVYTTSNTSLAAQAQLLGSWGAAIADQQNGGHCPCTAAAGCHTASTMHCCCLRVHLPPSRLPQVGSCASGSCTHTAVLAVHCDQSMQACMQQHNSPSRKLMLFSSSL
ncbi:hypothetical protein COO60DRAFT_152855 [Scenedesmus sp. NREL 46B-D3]|nr:hypothetical protein COO60DRAFT_152855 [Scenedesmus sp. NREL 46B-D3]